MPRTIPNDELLLRQEAASGNHNKVQEILERNKNAIFFINNRSKSNGNTALHWACYQVAKTEQGHSEKYAKTIRLLIEYGADHFIENNSGKKPRDFLTASLYAGITAKDSGYFALIDALLKKECEKIINNPVELKAESTIATFFYLIIDQLKLIEFFQFSSEIKQQDVFTILSVSCDFPADILPLLMYFRYHNKQVNYIGINMNTNVNIDEERRRYREYKNVTLIHADASDLKAMKKIIAPRSIDMGIVRNGDFSDNLHRRTKFINIVDKTLPSFLKSLAPLLMTFQQETELAVCKNETKIIDNFEMRRSGNHYDIGNPNSFIVPCEDSAFTVTPDKYGFILNLNETNDTQEKFSHNLRACR